MNVVVLVRGNSFAAAAAARSTTPRRRSMAPTVSPIARFLMRVVFSCYRSVRLVMMRLTSPTDERAARAVVSGAAWDEFCDTLKAAGASLVAPGAPTDAFNQAEGYRYLARLTRAGLENFLECADPEAPRLCAIANGDRPAPVKLGSDNPDNLYENATIDGRLECDGTRLGRGARQPPPSTALRPPSAGTS